MISAAGQIGGEHCVDHTQVTQVNAALEDDAAHHVSVVAATGDVGAAGEPCVLITALLGGSGPSYTPMREVLLVASDSLVLSVGGTTLDASHKTGAWIGETAWGLPYGDPGSFFQASGGGFSHLFARPSYQKGVHGIGSMRGVPDVAADGDPVTGYRSSRASGGRGLHDQRPAGIGTSAAVLPGQGSSPSPTSTRSATSASSTRRSTRSLAVTRYHQAFHDVTVGNNTAEFPPRRSPATEQGRAGTPLPAGGSPNAEVLVPLLAKRVSFLQAGVGHQRARNLSAAFILRALRSPGSREHRTAPEACCRSACIRRSVPLLGHAPVSSFSDRPASSIGRRRVRLDAARVDVAADEAPALHESGHRRRARAEKRIDDQLAWL